MAKKIVVDEKVWKQLCDSLLTELELSNLQKYHNHGREVTVEALHRTFQYYVVGFFRKVKQS